MGFRISAMTILKVTDPRKFEASLRRSITKHKGVGLQIAQDLDVSISTFKRWVEDSPELTKLMAQTRNVVISEMVKTRIDNPRKFMVNMRASIIKHHGVWWHIADDLGVSITTIKRWVEEAGLDKLMARSRKAAKAA